MNEQPPPLTPQEIAVMQARARTDLIGQPQTVKVFGIMHIVLGAYGVITVIGALLAILGINPILGLMPNSAEVSAQMEQQATMQAEMMPMTILSTIIAIAATTFIIMGGILMLKRRRDGLKWSNRYAWTSLFGKVVGLIVTIFFTYPMIKEMAGGVGSAGIPGGMEVVMIGSMIFGIVITCVYPILSLVLLNRPKTKAWFANLPE